MEKEINEFWLKNQPKVLIFIIFLMLYPLVSKLPYLNIFLSASSLTVFLCLIFVLLFRPSLRFLMIILFLGFFVIGLGVIFQKPELAAEASFFIYYFYLILIAYLFLRKKE